MTVYGRFVCQLCENEYQARRGAMCEVKTKTGTATICVWCGNKLVRLGFIQRDQVPSEELSTARIVEI